MEAILKYRISRTFTLVAALTALYASRDAVAQQVDRTVLPIPEPQPPVVTELSARDVSPPARFDVKAPQGAPNVVVVLLDDIGFGQSSAFGGPIKMPTLDKLAAGGLRLSAARPTSGRRRSSMERCPVAGGIAWMLAASEGHDGSFVGPYQVSRRERKDDRSNEEG
jgi:sulfatase-like protein